MAKRLLRIQPSQLIVLYRIQRQDWGFQLNDIADSALDDLRIVRFSDKIGSAQR